MVSPLGTQDCAKQLIGWKSLCKFDVKQAFPNPSLIYNIFLKKLTVDTRYETWRVLTPKGHFLRRDCSFKTFPLQLFLAFQIPNRNRRSAKWMLEELDFCTQGQKSDLFCLSRFLRHNLDFEGPQVESKRPEQTRTAVPVSLVPALLYLRQGW